MVQTLMLHRCWTHLVFVVFKIEVFGETSWTNTGLVYTSPEFSVRLQCAKPYFKKNQKTKQKNALRGDFFSSLSPTCNLIGRKVNGHVGQLTTDRASWWIDRELRAK